MRQSMTKDRRGFSALELTLAIGVVGLLFSIAIPAFGAMRMSAAFSNGEQAVAGLLSRARWSAINSGRAETRVLVEGTLLRVRAGIASDSPVVASVDLGDYVVTVSGANLPVRLDPRGIRLNPGDAVPTVTIANARISASRTFRVGPLGRASTS
jgi:type II secretory pathway pseudopilin PulG